MKRHRIFKPLISIVCLGFLAAASVAQSPVNLLKNGSFADAGTDGTRAEWKVTSQSQTVSIDKADLPAGIAQSLKVELKNAAESQGSVSQAIRGFPAGAKLVLTAQVKGTAGRLGSLNVKLKKEGKEVRRVKSEWNTTDWAEQKVEFTTEGADELTIECKFAQSEKSKGQTVWFAGLSLSEVK